MTKQKKLVRIDDSTMLFAIRRGCRGPIPRICLTHEQIRRLLIQVPFPCRHIYEINPKHPKQTVLLDINNYNIPTEELFEQYEDESKSLSDTVKITDEIKVERTIEPKEKTEEPVKKETVEDVVEDTQETIEEEKTEDVVVEDIKTEESIIDADTTEEEEDTDVKEEIATFNTSKITRVSKKKYI